MEKDYGLYCGFQVVVIGVGDVKIPKPGIAKAESNLMNRQKRKYLMSYQKTILPALHLLVAIHFIKKNLESVLDLVNEIRLSYPEKTIWLYTGYTLEQIMYPVVTDDFNPERDKLLKMRREIVKQCDVLVDGRYEEDKRDVAYHWAGSTNQRVIDVKKTLEQGSVVLWENQ